MKLISHRGNTRGKNPKYENHPDYILNVLKYDYDCEIDVWYVEDKWFLGHDEPQYEIDFNFLLNEKLWCHAKNIEALYHLTLQYKIKCFFHNTDDVVLTSNGLLWTYPNKLLTKKSIAVLPEISNYNEKDLYIAYAICSDNIEEYKK